MLSSQLDLALAYSPGVAEPCKEIAADVNNVYKYTAKGNLVGVISNGTAVLGLGNIGPEASKPVMEGKGVLFKKFAGIDVFDIEINCEDPQEFIKIVKSMEPTFGGINLEDIKAPESFVIEEALRNQMQIPIMHDDQHGTAIISSAALLGALSLTGKKIEDLKLVVNGAGASAIACTKLYLSLGIRVENVVMVDREGVIRKDRAGLDRFKSQFATTQDLYSLDDAIVGVDMFLGLSAANVLKPSHLLKMADNPIVFALANPDPEIEYELAMRTRPDIIMATGRSDHPNQVNNVLGFPYIFRGALDVRATQINEAMKLAAVYALADLAKASVPDIVNRAYGDKKLNFGREYLIPKPLDPRLITAVSPAVARAAMESGVARKPITNWEAYDVELHQRLGIDQKLIARVINRAQKFPKRVVFCEADNYKVLKAVQMILDEKIAYPLLLGNKEKIAAIIKENNLEIGDCPIYDPFEDKEMAERYAQLLFEKRKRKGVTPYEAKKLMRDRNYFGASMVELGEAEVMISGLTKDYPKTLRPALQVIGVDPLHEVVAGMYILNTVGGIYFFADTTVNANPTVNELVDIIEQTAKTVRFFDIEPRIAVLSYSNFGSSRGEIPEKAAEAALLAKQRNPDLIIDGDIQANFALNKQLIAENYPFSELAKEGANTLIFPNLAAGNISYKLLQELGGAELIGPILMGMNKPVYVLQLGSSVRDIVNMAAIAVIHAQNHQNKA